MAIQHSNYSYNIFKPGLASSYAVSIPAAIACAKNRYLLTSFKFYETINIYQVEPRRAKLFFFVTSRFHVFRHTSKFGFLQVD